MESTILLAAGIQAIKVCALILIAVLFLLLYVLFPGRPTAKQTADFRGRYYAHRGLHNRDKTIPENSLPAFAAAVQAGYGIELDVQLSSDGQVVVFHDDDLDRVCGVSAPVASLSYKDLSHLSLCETPEHIPLFSEVLQVIHGTVPLIVELKTGSRNNELCRKTYAFLKAYSGPVCVESFDPKIVSWFRFHAPEIFRGQLAMPAERYSIRIPPLGRKLMSITAVNFLSRPQFIAYRIGKTPCFLSLVYKLGAMKICWTSHKESDHRDQDGVIFEYYTPPTTFH